MPPGTSGKAIPLRNLLRTGRWSTWIGRMRMPTASGQANVCRRKRNGKKPPREHNDWRFPWGNVEPTNKHLNFNQKWIGEKTLMPVGSYEAGKSPYRGLRHGRQRLGMGQRLVRRQVLRKEPNKNPKGPETGTKRVLRGSGWQNETPTVRIFTRVDSDPTIRNESTGFRCAPDAK